MPNGPWVIWEMGLSMADKTHTDVPAAYRAAADLIQSLRTSPERIHGLLETLRERPERFVDLCTNGAVSSSAASHPVFVGFADAAFQTLDIAQVLTRLDAHAQSQLTRDFIAGEWMAISLNARGWCDCLLLMEAMETGVVSTGWRSGFGSKMTALWNSVEAEHLLIDARKRLYWLRAVSFGDAPAMMAASNTPMPMDIPRNGALQAELIERAEEVARLQAGFDTARRNLLRASANIQREGSVRLAV